MVTVVGNSYANQKGSSMKTDFSAVAIALVLCAYANSAASATDFDYFKSQSCKELSEEMVMLLKGEKAVTEKMAKAEGKANTQAVVTTIFFGWPAWGNVDHGDSNNMLAEIRTDMKYVTRAQKANKCS
jgi:hypothetical protein